MPDTIDDALRHQILRFLKEFKDLMGQGRYYIMSHYKTQQALIEMGITEKQRDEIILSLVLDDYCSGPNQDKLHSGNYWVLGKIFETREIYIKLKIVTLFDGDEKAVCISFHPSEYPMKYPTRK
jgi:hypothetical protein